MGKKRHVLVVGLKDYYPERELADFKKQIQARVGCEVILLSAVTSLAVIESTPETSRRVGFS